jgi:hypothetical protein
MAERDSPLTRLDSKLISCLRLDLRLFTEQLGDPQWEDQGVSFPSGAHPFHHFTVGYALNNKFLGKIYLMTLEGTVTGPMPVTVPGSLDLCYPGFIKKGRPFFTRKDYGGLLGTESRLLSLLNNNQELLEECWRLEIEFLKIFFDPREGLARVQVRPYGGSLVRIILPPLHYHVRLVPEQAVLILAVMNRIAESIKHIHA